MSRRDDRLRLVDHERAVLGHPLPGINLAVIGMYSEEELDRSVAWVRRWQLADGGRGRRSFWRAGASPAPWATTTGS